MFGILGCSGTTNLAKIVDLLRSPKIRCFRPKLSICRCHGQVVWPYTCFVSQRLAVIVSENGIQIPEQ